jgi:hypothetical protein
MATTKIASCGCYGEGSGAGKKVEERFFLDWVYMIGTGEPVDKGV